MGLTNSPTSDFLLLAILALIGAHGLRLHVQNRWLAFDPLHAFWAGVLMCYIQQPIIYGSQFDAWHSPGTMDRTLFWILFSLVFVIIGYELRFGQHWARVIPPLPTRLDPRRLSAAGASLIGLGIFGYLYIFASAGGFDRWVSMARGATDWINVSAYIAMLPYFLPVGVALLLFHVEFHHVSVLRRGLVWSLAALVWLWLVYQGTRSRTIEMTLLMLAARYLPLGRNPSPMLLIPVFIGLVLLTDFQGRYRENFTNLSFNLDRIDSSEGGWLPAWAGGTRQIRRAERGMEFNCVMTVVDLVPDRVDYNYGSGLQEFLTRPIPRAIWPEKPYPGLEAVYPIMKEGDLSSTYVASSKKPLLMGPALTFTGYWYAAGGPIALAIAGILTGCLLRMIRTVHDGARASQGHLILFTFLISIGFLEAVTTPLAWAFTLPFIILPLFALLRFAAVRPTTVPAPPALESGEVEP